MTILIAPDKFKGSLTALQAAQAVERGIKRADPAVKTILLPLADGGEGTVDAILNAVGGEKEKVTVTGPLGTPVNAHFGVVDKATAIIEMAAASGLQLVPEAERNPMNTTTYGTGELVIAALNKGCKRIIVGIGGSATNDAGMGMAMALGAKFFSKEDREFETGNGKNLSKVRHIDTKRMDPRIKSTEFVVASDVQNTLYGPEGAAYVYAPQKGASPDIIEALDRGLRNFSSVIKNDLGMDITAVRGAGAAGGSGGGFIAFTGANLVSGIDLVIEMTGFLDRLKEADLVVTGEGKIDKQSLYGKVVSGVAVLAERQRVPVVAICGRMAGDVEEFKRIGLDRIFAIADEATDTGYAMQNAAKLLEDKTRQMYHEFKMRT